MNKVLSLFCLIFLFSCQKSTKLSEIEIQTKEIYVNNVKINQQENLTVSIKNPSSNDLIIYGIQPSCSCTVLQQEEFIISANQSYMLNIDYNPKELGRQEETIVLKANTDPPFHTIKIKALVVSE